MKKNLYLFNEKGVFIPSCKKKCPKSGFLKLITVGWGESGETILHETLLSTM